MLRNIIQSTLRTLRRQPVHAGVNLFGLALGLGATVLILSFVRSEWSFDSDVPAAADVYRVDIHTISPDGVPEEWAGVPLPLAPALQEETDLIDSATRLMIRQHSVRTEGGMPAQANVIYTDRAFFDVFRTAEDPFEGGWAPEQVILSRSMAARLGAGPGDVIGIEESGTERDVTVAAVLADPPVTSSFRFDVMASIDGYPGNVERFDSWTSWVTNSFVRLRPGTDTAALAGILESFTASRMEDMHRTWRMLEWIRDDGESFALALTPLSSIHLMPDVQVVQTPVSDPSYLRILLGLGVALLLIACINFTTLSVGRATRRAREVGVRKVLGATRHALIAQFLTEAIFLSGLAVAGAILIAEAFGPAFADMVGAERVPAVIDSARTALLLGALVLVTGLVAGAYPAWYLSRFDSGRALASVLRTRRRNPWMQVLVTMQFAASILLLVGVFATSAQLEHLRTRDLGYEPDRIVVAPVSMPDADAADSFVEQLRAEAEEIPGVIDVAGSSTGLAGGLSWNGFTTPEGARYVYVNRIDHHFMEMMQMEVVAGRGFDESRPSDAHAAVLVNEALVREFGWDDPVGQPMPGIDLVEGDERPEVIGVVRDFHFKTLHTPVEPMVFFLPPRGPEESFKYVWLKLGPGAAGAALDRVSETWARLDPGSTFDWTFLDDALAERYVEDERTRRTARYAAAFAILIACLGLFGLAAFSAERRTKEIGIRKVLGATAARMSLMMSAEFGILVLAANAVALPVGWFLLDRWLDTYPYRIELGWGMPAAAAAISFTVAMAVVLSQVHRTAMRNPVESLRTE